MSVVVSLAEAPRLRKTKSLSPPEPSFSVSLAEAPRLRKTNTMVIFGGQD